jgi:HK97 family phage portal protein
MANIITRSIGNFIEKRFSNVINQAFGAGAFAAFNEWWGSSANEAKEEVNAQTSQKLSAFYEAVSAISEDIAKLPFVILLKDSQGNKKTQPSHPAAYLFDKRPNPVNIPMVVKELIIRSAIVRGNGYAFIERNNDGDPVNIYYLPNEAVQPIVSNKRLFYVVNDPYLGISGTYTSEYIFHLRGMGNGWVGISVIQYASESMGSAIAAQKYKGKFFGGGASMTGLLKLGSVKDENDAKAKKTAFMNTYKEDGIAAVNATTGFEKISVTPNEAQFIETQEFNVKDIHRWLRYVDKNAFPNNLEARQITYVNDCLTPWMTRFEQEVELKLLTEQERPFLEAWINPVGLLRGDSASIERTQKMLFYTGQATTNDLLRMNNMNSIGPQGDHRYLPVNMIPDNLVELFWEGKTPNNIPLNSPDPSGTGADNGNVKQNENTN